jgi:hypothetical protein
MKIKYKDKIIEITLPWAVRLTMLVANIAVVLGIIFAAVQYSYSKENNRRLFAIDAVNRFYNNEFLKSTAILNTPNIDLTSVEYIDASNCIFNTYYLIAIVYNKEIADNEIIGKAIKFELNRYVKTDSFKKKANKDVCNEILIMSNSITFNKY